MKENRFQLLVLSPLRRVWGIRMIVLYGAVLAAYFILFLLLIKEGMIFCRNNRKDIARQDIFGKMADYIYQLCLKHKILRQTNVRKSLGILHPGIGGKEERERKYLHQFYVNKIRYFLLFIFIGDALAIGLFISSRMSGSMTEGKYISRNAYGMGNKEVDLEVQIDSNQGKIRQNFAVTLEEQRYEDILVKRMAKEMTELLPDMIQGVNASIEEVRNDLNLVRSVQGYPFQIMWESDDYSLVHSDGTVMNEEIGEEGKIVSLTAVLTYGDYKEEYIFPVYIFPPLYSEEELIKKKIDKWIVKQEEGNRYKEKLELPEMIEGRQLIWSERIEDNSGYIFLLVCVGACMAYLLQDRGLKEKISQRNRQMLIDYPQLISKLMLYLGAGMTIRNAFQRIAHYYNKEKQETGKLHYVYEEMLLICHELDSGISEAAAYEHFGKKCRLPQYTKLSNILIQNLKKGSNSILNALRQEAENAFEERKSIARKLGEEAGTKLLLPMMLMFGIVMILIMIPAYFSFAV